MLNDNRPHTPPVSKGAGAGIGFVSIIGAGPGAADLLTLRAARRLREADLVLHDALVPPEILALASRARIEPVGRRCGQEGPPVEAVVARLVEAARDGAHAVRLQGGDPFVFARGGEEIAALAAAGVPFEVIPGVSSALSAATLAGIPITQRGIASSFAVVSGHAPEAYAPLVAALPPRGVTLVVLMGVSRRAEIAETLLAQGFDPATPAAVLLSASLPRAWNWRGTLQDLRTLELPPERLRDPGVLIIGAVAAPNGQESEDS